MHGVPFSRFRLEPSCSYWPEFCLRWGRWRDIRHGKARASRPKSANGYAAPRWQRAQTGRCLAGDVRGEMVVYSYAIRGVEYTASQDVSSIREFFPAEESLGGPCGCGTIPRTPPIRSCWRRTGPACEPERGGDSRGAGCRESSRLFLAATLSPTPHTAGRATDPCQPHS